MPIYEQDPEPPSEVELLNAILPIPDHHSWAGVKAVRQKFNDGGYDSLMDASIDAYGEGREPDALVVPMIRFIMDAAHVGLEQFDDTNVLGPLKHNVAARADVAANYALAANRFAMDTALGLFGVLYHQHPRMAAAVDSDDDLVFQGLFSRRYLAGHAISVYKEVETVAGGAVNFLHNKKSEFDGTQVRDTIINSDGLRRIGLVHQRHIRKRYRALGFPYVDQNRFRYDEDTGKLTLTDETLDYFRSLRTKIPGGCPANIVKYTPHLSNEAVNAMSEGWKEVAAFIVTDQAVTHSLGA